MADGLNLAARRPSVVDLDLLAGPVELRVSLPAQAELVEQFCALYRAEAAKAREMAKIAEEERAAARERLVATAKELKNGTASRRTLRAVAGGMQRRPRQ